jgi:O-succinylbenzoic acid--CoA ligase
MIHLNGKYYTHNQILNFDTNDCEEYIRDAFHFLKAWAGGCENFEIRTSGSTGPPKLISLARQVMETSALNTGRFLDWKGGESALMVLPARFIAGKMMLVRAIVWQLELEIQPPASKIEPLRNYHFTALTPMQAKLSFSSLHRFGQIILGGEAVTTSFTEQLQEIPAAVWHTYGMTETASHVAMKRLNGLEPQNCFNALQGITFSVDFRDCLQIHASFLTDQLQTNDVVRLINNQQFEWLGRWDDVINTGGIKVFPQQIEEKLKPYIIVPYYVTSISHAVFGEAVALVIQGEGPIPDLSMLEKYEKPVEVIREHRFEFTPTGKIVRKKY